MKLLIRCFMVTEFGIGYEGGNGMTNGRVYETKDKGLPKCPGCDVYPGQYHSELCPVAKQEAERDKDEKAEASQQ